MNKHEAKIKKRYGTVDQWIYGPALIHTDGTFSHCDHLTHEKMCARAGTALSAYLHAGGLRVKVYQESIAVEGVLPLTEEQISAVGQILRRGDFHVLVIAIGDDYESVDSFEGRLTKKNFTETLEKIGE